MREQQRYYAERGYRLDQHIDMTQSMGKLMFHFLAGFAEFACLIRKEGQAESIEKALQKGVRFGRAHKLTKT